MDRPLSRKERSHARIVEAASRAVRARGFEGVGVAEVMSEAGLTHGGFYAHFASRDELLVAAVEHAGKSSMTALAGRRGELPRGANAFRAFVHDYLSERALKAPETGCIVAALCSDIPRQTTSVRRASAARVRELIRHVGALLPELASPEAALVASTLVGSLQMARSLPPAHARALLIAARDDLIDRHVPA